MCFSQPRDTKTVLCDTTDFSIDLIPRKYRGSIVDASTNTDTLNQKKKAACTGEHCVMIFISIWKL